MQCFECACGLDPSIDEAPVEPTECLEASRVISGWILISAQLIQCGPGKTSEKLFHVIKWSDCIAVNVKASSTGRQYQPTWFSGLCLPCASFAKNQRTKIISERMRGLLLWKLPGSPQPRKLSCVHTTSYLLAHLTAYPGAGLPFLQKTYKYIYIYIFVYM